MTTAALTKVSMRTGAWHGDRPLELDLPAAWRVRTWWPRTPTPLSDEQLRRCLASPVAARPLREIAAGRRRPVVIVDDPTRPTPAARVLPQLLDELAAAGIGPEDVRVVIATGTHGAPDAAALAGKLGPVVRNGCAVHVHRDTGDVVRVGRTSFGTPVLVDRAVADADLVVGVGGIYPQHSTGFGGGSKLALGVLGRRSITRLHYRHDGVRGSYETGNDFRRDLDEIATMIGLRWSVSLHVDAERRVVRAACGDPLRYHAGEVAFCRQAYAAPVPGNADVVVANAYPSDVSLTFVHSKGIIPLTRARAGASRICVAACPEGVGRHGLFPFADVPRLQRERHLLRKVRARPADAAAAAARRIRARLRGRPAHAPASHPVLLYLPEGRPSSFPRTVPGMTVLTDWGDVLARVAQEQCGAGELDVAVYPCAPLQVLTEEAG